MEYRLLLSKKAFEDMCMRAAACEDVNVVMSLMPAKRYEIVVAIAVAGALDHLRKEIFRLSDELEEV